MSRHCKSNVATLKSNVMTLQFNVATLTLGQTERPENCYFGLFSSPFHPMTINTRFIGFFGEEKRWENTSHGVSLSKTFPFFSFSFFSKVLFFLA